MTNRPPSITRRRWVFVSSATAVIPPPRAWDPTSPMMIRAGQAFHQRKPSEAPMIADATVARPRLPSK